MTSGILNKLRESGESNQRDGKFSENNKIQKKRQKERNYNKWMFKIQQIIAEKQLKKHLLIFTKH